MRDLLLIAHIGAAITFIGPLTVATSLFPRFAEAGDADAMAAFHRISRVYGVLAVAVAVIGLALAAQTGYLSSGWVWLSLVLFAVGAAVLGVVVLPSQRRALTDGTADVATLTRLRAGAGSLGVLWVTVLALMVTKPF